jgi:hypothetical protein
MNYDKFGGILSAVVIVGAVSRFQPGPVPRGRKTMMLSLLKKMRRVVGIIKQLDVMTIRATCQPQVLMNLDVRSAD